MLLFSPSLARTNSSRALRSGRDDRRGVHATAGDPEKVSPRQSAPAARKSSAFVGRIASKANQMAQIVRVRVKRRGLQRKAILDTASCYVPGALWFTIASDYMRRSGWKFSPSPPRRWLNPPDTLRSSEGEQHRLQFHTPEVDRASERKIDLIGRPS